MQDSDSRLAALYRRFDNIDTVLDGYNSASQMMTPGGRVLQEQAEALLLNARQALAYRCARSEQIAEPWRETLRRQICDDFAAVLHELAATLLPALDGGRSNGVPIELEPVMSRLARRAANGTEGCIVLFASEHLNYSIQRHPDPIATLAPKLAPGLPAAQAGEPFLFLRIPRIERDSATLHTIIAGHELGHLRDWTYQLSALRPPISVPAHWVDSAGVIKLEFAGQWARFQAVAIRWAGELVADIVGALIFGPASASALSELVGTLGAWVHDSRSHPAPDRRLALLVDLLVRQGFGSLPDVTGLISHFHAETSSALGRPVQIKDSPFPEADQAAWTLVRAKLPDLEQACRAAVAADEHFGPADWPSVDDAAKRLAAGQPSGEAFDAAGGLHPNDDAVILNAAFLVRSRSLGDLAQVLGLERGDTAGASQTSAVLDELVLKSFEIAEFRRRKVWA